MGCGASAKTAPLALPEVVEPSASKPGEVPSKVGEGQVIEDLATSCGGSVHDAASVNGTASINGDDAPILAHDAASGNPAPSEDEGQKHQSAQELPQNVTPPGNISGDEDGGQKQQNSRDLPPDVTQPAQTSRPPSQSSHKSRDSERIADGVLQKVIKWPTEGLQSQSIEEVAETAAATRLQSVYRGHAVRNEAAIRRRESKVDAQMVGSSPAEAVGSSSEKKVQDSVLMPTVGLAHVAGAATTTKDSKDAGTSIDPAMSSRSVTVDDLPEEVLASQAIAETSHKVTRNILDLTLGNMDDTLSDTGVSGEWEGDAALLAHSSDDESDGGGEMNVSVREIEEVYEVIDCEPPADLD